MYKFYGNSSVLMRTEEGKKACFRRSDGGVWRELRRPPQLIKDVNWS